MRNPSEDHSFWGEYYFAYPEWLRQHIRAEAARGNFAPAVKYLYLKRISFLDFNGRSREYRLTPRIHGDEPFSIEEFRRIAAGFRSLTPEQTHLRDLAEQIEQAARQMVSTGKITRAFAGDRDIPKLVGVPKRGS